MADGDRRTFADYKNEVLYALGLTANDASQLDEMQPERVVNDAMEELVTMHRWRWLQTGEQSLDLVAGQNYVELPADFGTLVAIEQSRTFTSTMIPVPWEELLRMRQEDFSGWSGSFYYTINTGNVAVGDEDAGLDLPIIALYPAPSADETGAIRLVYHRFLRRMTADTDRPQWPAYMDRPLSLYARAMAKQDHDDEPNPPELARFGIALDRAIRTDGRTMPSLGIPRGGLVPRYTRADPFYPTNIPDPSGP